MLESPALIEAHKNILTKARWAWHLACTHCGLGSIPEPHVDLTLRGRAAGQARVSIQGKRGVRSSVEMRLRFNFLAYQLDPERFLSETVPHEVAHLIAWIRFGRSVAPHGREWASIMADCFGLPATRTHVLDLQPTRRVLPRYLYRCACRDHLLTGIRHKRTMLQKMEYRCRSCGQPLQFIQERRSNPSDARING